MLPLVTDTSTPRTVDCRAGLCRIDGKTAVFIESPRTGRRIAIECTAAPDRIRGRIVKGASVGKLRIPFTTDELRALAAIIQSPAPAPEPEAAPSPRSMLEWMKRRPARISRYRRR